MSIFRHAGKSWSSPWIQVATTMPQKWLMLCGWFDVLKCLKPIGIFMVYIYIILYHIIYPLVNVYITMERSTMLSTGKSTISMAIFNSLIWCLKPFAQWALWIQWWYNESWNNSSTRFMWLFRHGPCNTIPFVFQNVDLEHPGKPDNLMVNIHFPYEHRHFRHFHRKMSHFHMEMSHFHMENVPHFQSHQRWEIRSNFFLSPGCDPDPHWLHPQEVRSPWTSSVSGTDPDRSPEMAPCWWSCCRKSELMKMSAGWIFWKPQCCEYVSLQPSLLWTNCS